MEPRERIVVVGAGLAGNRLAQHLGAVHDVTLIAEEPHPAYNRVLLAEVLAGHYPADVIRLPRPPHATRREARAVRVDRAARTVQCDDGAGLPYDRLVLATGSNPVLPPLRGLFAPGGHELPAGVHAFRTLDDCLALAAATRADTRVVVIGGGLLGSSAARALARRGAQVVLAHQGEHLMERQLDAQASRMLRTHLEGLGVEVHTECRVRGLRCAPDGVRAVELADGYRLTAELVVLACGVRPRTGLARAAGLETARGIVVDDELRTSDPYIHALGDCAEHRGTVYGLAGPALDQADTLARVLTGGKATYEGSRVLTRLTLVPDSRTPLDLAAFGDPVPGPDDDVIQLADATRRAYRKVVVRDGRLVGGILLGDLAAVGALARAWEADEPLPDDVPLLHLLTHPGGP
ncbi:Nitrite reductase [NAD(P)H] [Streptomyces sp. RB5]|uniref:Nitrite reductase [NAD(P)H] n=1 Tax=Streptomyces smaragdinus TaxID=2585196 RepID=A0A7K0CDH3_9ACTN|nr:FAD-dependent oxidoreductase [Streptomyces smaragdinus]MQY11518.1 Nitrite reductase [NAD(P)H] [Streptomyces smaragdinus]